MLKLGCFRVEPEFSDGEYGGSFGLPGFATQQGFHPNNKFWYGEGLLEIVAPSQVEAGDNVIDRCLGGQEEDGRLLIALADGFHHFEAGHLGHHHVHYEDVRAEVEVAVQAFGAIGSNGNFKVLGLQGIPHDAGQGEFVFYKEYAASHSSMVNVLPLPGSLWTEMRPPCFSTMVLAKKRPMP